MTLHLHGSVIRHIITVLVIIAAIAAMIETFIFNMNYWLTSGYDCINISDRLTLQKNSDKTYKLTELNHVMEFSNLNKEIHNIRIDFDDEQAAQTVQVKINFTDDAHETYFYSNEYAEGIPSRTVATNDDSTEYLKLDTAGYTNNLRIEVTGKDINYPIKVNAVYINNVYPFHFQPLRFWLLVAIMLLIYIFRPRSAIYKYYLIEHPHASKACIAGVVAIEIWMVCAFLFFGSNLVGVATSNYNSGSWDRKSLVTSYAVGGENSQQYANLAKAMADGKLYLEEDPPDWLVSMDNPYDRGARDEVEKQTGEEYLWDVAYYNGHYYVYFGVVPVIVFYLPFYLLTHTAFPTAIGVLISCIAFMLGCTALLDRFARYHFKRVSLGLYLLLQIPLIFCSGILYLIKFPTFYSLPIMMALAFTVWGLYLWMRGRRCDRPHGWYLGGSLCMALVLGCRPQLMVLSLVAIPLFWRRYITKKRLFTRRGAGEVACLLAPYVLVAAGIMWYNKARFGSLFDFGSAYNLTTNDMTKRGWDLGRIPSALFAFFLQTPHTTGVFPFLSACTFQTTYMGQTIKEATFGGIFACFPILWILAFVKPILSMRIKARSTRTIAGVVIVLLIGGVLVALADAEMAGILQRYFADFSFMFLLIVILLIFIVNENLKPESSLRRTVTCILAGLIGIGLLYSILLCIVPETSWYSDTYSWAYQGILRLFQFWT
ncbi:MAG: cytochrome C oxidase Cbb3 [Eggerthellaceae bacterium]|jgi:hypothetical protein|nr:cytochrome C oxidase Cbb3 [Eggerthellaceae bacterium]MCH4220783.1 cytochrome C oxidase Cbb3 [Eggerthellaceae bacterium]